jgi:hypothetical protein
MTADDLRGYQGRPSHPQTRTGGVAFWLHEAPIPRGGSGLLQPWGTGGSPRALVLVLAVATALSQAACERGCGREVLQEVGALGPEKTEVHRFRSELDAIDCPGGRLRCQEGVVSRSIEERIPAPCPTEVACQCRWRMVRTCPRGCVLQIDETTPMDEGLDEQYCAPADTGFFIENAAGTPLGAMTVVEPSSACRHRSYFCQAAEVRMCSPEGRELSVGKCRWGCVDAPLEGVEQEISPRTALALGCLRHPKSDL